MHQPRSRLDALVMRRLHNVEEANMKGMYILDNHTPVPMDTSTEEVLIKWAQWMLKADRLVAKTQINDSIEVSTVFLGLDHNYCGGKPVLFETMVFRDGHGDEMDRCCTWEEAEAMHEKVVRQVKGELGA